MIQGLLGKYPNRFLLQSFLLICSFIQHLVPEGLLLPLEGTEMDEWHKSSSLETLVELKGKGTCKHSSAKMEPCTREMEKRGTDGKGDQGSRERTLRERQLEL